MTCLLFTGDIAITNPPAEILEPELKNLIKTYDLVSCNVEGPITSSDKTIKKIGPPISQPLSVFKKLKDSGFTLFNLANNHIGDYGLSAINKTIKELEPLPTIGAGENFSQAYGLYTKEMEGAIFGFLSLAEWGFGAFDELAVGGYAWINHPKVNTLIIDAKQIVDVLIIQIHAGVENIDVPLPQWREFE